MAKEGTRPMTLYFPRDIYYYLRAIADIDRRSMAQEVFFLIEQAATELNLQLDVNIETDKTFIDPNTQTKNLPFTEKAITANTEFLLRIMRARKNDWSWGKEVYNDEKPARQAYDDILALVKSEGLDPGELLEDARIKLPSTGYFKPRKKL